MIQNKRIRRSLPVEGTVSTRDGAGVYVELVLVFKRIKPMCVSGDENVNIQLSLDHRKTLCVSPWNNLMPMTQTNAEVTNCYHLLLWVVQILYVYNHHSVTNN